MGGANGPDIRENLLWTCSTGDRCHGAQHWGWISKEEFLRAAVRRENITVAECKYSVRKAMDMTCKLKILENQTPKALQHFLQK